MHISYSFVVLELFFPPITKTKSASFESSCTLFCLTSVAEQIVLKATISLLALTISFKTLFQVSFFSVVCETTQTFAGIFSSSVFPFVIMAESLHQPLIPITSG